METIGFIIHSPIVFAEIFMANKHLHKWFCSLFSITPYVLMNYIRDRLQILPQTLSEFKRMN